MSVNGFFQSAEQMFKALANSYRIQILTIVGSNKDMCAKEIARELELSQPDVSYHLSKLRQVGALEVRKEGTRHCYTLNRQSLERVGIDPEQLLRYQEVNYSE